MATSNESKSIFVSTLEFIGSIVAVLLFATILFGIFTNSFERMLWQLFDWIVEILKPIASILLLIVAVFRGLPLLVSFLESIVEDMRAEKEYKEVWDRLELSSPTPQVASNQKAPLDAKEAVKTDNPSESRGTDKGFDFNKFKQGSPGAANAYKNSDESKAALDKLRTLDQLIEEARKVKNV